MALSLPSALLLNYSDVIISTSQRAPKISKLFDFLFLSCSLEATAAKRILNSLDTTIMRVQKGQTSSSCLSPSLNLSGFHLSCFLNVTRKLFPCAFVSMLRHMGVFALPRQQQTASLPALLLNDKIWLHVWWRRIIYSAILIQRSNERRSVSKVVFLASSVSNSSSKLPRSVVSNDADDNQMEIKWNRFFLLRQKNTEPAPSGHTCKKHTAEIVAIFVNAIISML